MNRHWRDRAAAMLSSDAVLALSVAGLAFVVYVRTLLPDIGGPEDTPKFQHLGAALGTAHVPGYPLHTMLAHLFSYLPFGTVAYRANLLSAVAGAGGVLLAVLLARAVGASRWAAALAGLATAFGASYWTYSVLAEVYSLAACLLLGVAVWLVRWRRSRARRDLLVAAGWFALALGNHTSIAAAVPAIAAFVLLTDARRALQLRTLVPAAVIAASGFLLYLYIVVRTWSAAAFMEARAETLGELVGVVSGRSHADLIFAFDWMTLASDRLPVFAAAIHDEIGAVGVALAVLGGVTLFRRDWRTGALLTGAMVGIMALMMNIVGDVKGFLVSPLALAGAFVAAGADAIARPFAGWRGRPAAVVALALFAYPTWLLADNFSRNDWSRSEQPFFYRAVARQLPARSTFVAEDYNTDSAMNYFRAVEHDNGRRQIGQIPLVVAEIQRALEDRDTPIFAFDRSAAMLRVRGFVLSQVDLRGPPIEDVISALPRGTRVVAASTMAGIPPALLQALHTGEPDAPRQRVYPFVAIAATVGSPGIRWAEGDGPVNASIEIGAGTLSPAGDGAGRLTAEASLGRAVIRLDGGIVDESVDGLAVGVLDAQGHLATYTAERPDFRIRLTGRRLFRVSSFEDAGGVDFGDGTWHELTTLAENGSLQLLIDNYRPFDAHVTLYASADTPLLPDLNRWPGRRSHRPALEVRDFDRTDAAGLVSLGQALAADGVPPGLLDEGARFVVRIEYEVNDDGEWAGWQMAFGGQPRQVIGRAETDMAGLERAKATAVLPLTVSAREGPLEFPAGRASSWLIGQGWSAPEFDGDGEFRRTTAPEAHLLLPLEPAALTIGVDAGAQSVAGAPSSLVRLVVNGVDLGVCAPETAGRFCSWSVPAQAVRPGLNDVVLAAPASAFDAGPAGDSSSPGVVVRAFRLALDAPTP